MARMRAASADSVNSSASHLSSVPDNYEVFDNPAGNASYASITPATSLPDNASDPDLPDDAAKRRSSGRARSFVRSYNEAERSGTAVHRRKSFPAKGATSRTVSGATTLVEKDSPSRQLLQENGQGVDEEWGTGEEGERKGAASVGASPAKVQRRQSTRRQLENAASSVADALTSATSALGKRSRDAVDSARDALRGGRSEPQRESRTRGAANTTAGTKNGKEDTVVGALSAKLSAFPGLQGRVLAQEKEQERIKAEKARLAAPRTIKSVDRGLYFGMERNYHPRQQNEVKAKGKKKADDDFSELDGTWLPLPMAAGERLFREGRDYKLPFNILNPRPTNEAPKDWKTLNKNRFIGDAGPTWRKDNGQYERSQCSCRSLTGCGDKTGVESCVNATMHYECNSDNCPLPENQCFNRPFAELQRRARAKNEFRNPEKQEYNMFGEGVEVFKTPDRGHGVRAMRSYVVDQIVVEYCGEIITQEEADRRMNTDYKDKNNYYLMDFHEGLIIDATRGSLCRFVNHSCDPNCRVEKWSVSGEPRMALFAARNIDVGEELTYDYNFDPFSKDNMQPCYCGADNCRGFIGPKPKDQRSKMIKQIEKAVKGVKRKFTKALGGDVSSEDGDQPQDKKRRKTLPDPRALLAKAKKQLVKAPTPVSTLALPDVSAIEQAKSRADRAAKRHSSGETLINGKSPRKLTKRHSETSVSISKLKGSPLRATSKGNRNSTGNLLRKAPPKGSPLKPSTQIAKSSKSLDKLKDTLKKNVAAVLDSAKSNAASSKLAKTLLGPASTTTKANSGPVATSRSSSKQHLLNQAGSNPSLRQSRLSFAGGAMSLRSSTQSPVSLKKFDPHTHALVASPTGKKVASGRITKKRSTGSPAPTGRPTSSAARPGTAMSVANSVKGAAVRSVKGTRRAAAIGRLGLQGDAAVRKTIRTVSGAE